MNTLTGKTIVMMGATGGIGTATAMKIAAPGVNIAFCSAKENRVQELSEKLAQTGANVFSAVVDVTSPARIHDFMEAVMARFGRVDTLINFAGLSITRNLEDFTEEDYNTVMDVNVKGMVFSTKEFLSHVNEEEGALVVSFGSMAAKRPNPKAPHYSAAKIAVNMFNDAFTQQIKGRNIRFTTINPGPVDTTFFEGRIPKDKRGNFMQPEEVADVLEFILTHDNLVFHDVAFESTKMI